MPAWNRPDRRIILASQSPRRKQIFAQMGFMFETLKPRVEDEQSYIDPSDIFRSLQTLAVRKARSVSEQCPHALVVGTDTVVVLDDTVFGKPANLVKARAMIRSLSGRLHTVYSAVALVCEECAFTQSETAATVVRFRAIPEGEIDEYLAEGEYADKAGAYGIQGRAMTFVERIEGCYYNVMGLPVGVTIRLFENYSRRKEHQ